MSDGVVRTEAYLGTVLGSGEWSLRRARDDKRKAPAAGLFLRVCAKKDTTRVRAGQTLHGIEERWSMI
jgi:hypothetical protein